MDEGPDRLRSEIERRLLGGAGLPATSTARRLFRTAGAALRTGRLALGRRRGADGDGADPTMDGPTVDDPKTVEAVWRIAASLGDLKGIAMKVGQVMSYIDVALPEEVRRALAALQTAAPPMPPEQVRAVVEGALGPARGAALFAAMEARPVAAASIGQVHRARLPSGGAAAVKVQYPGIEQAIAADFRPAGFGGRMASLIYPGARIDGLVAEARARFLEECDYAHEAAAQQRFAALFEGHPTLLVPAVHAEWSARRVLTTAWVDGRSFDALLATGPAQAVRDRIGVALFEFYIGSLFRHGLYNCDPHPGNYLFPADGRVALLDHGCSRAFEPDFVARLADLTFAVHADEPQGLHRAFLGLGMVHEGRVPERRTYDFETARRLVRSFFGPMLRDETAAVDLGEAATMRDLMKSKRQLLKLTLPGEFLFLFRIRFGLMSVLARLGARANWHRLERDLIEGSPLLARRTA